MAAASEPWVRSLGVVSDMRPPVRTSRTRADEMRIAGPATSGPLRDRSRRGRLVVARAELQIGVNFTALEPVPANRAGWLFCTSC